MACAKSLYKMRDTRERHEISGAPPETRNAKPEIRNTRHEMIQIKLRRDMLHCCVLELSPNLKYVPYLHLLVTLTVAITAYSTHLHNTYSSRLCRIIIFNHGFIFLSAIITIHPLIDQLTKLEFC